MIKDLIHDGRFWRKINLISILLITILSTAAVLTYIYPMKIPLNADLGDISQAKLREERFAFSDSDEIIKKLNSQLRQGLFKSASVSHSKPLADKTIERIKSKLKLQCVMNLNGQKTAYIRIKEQGMKRCGIGDSVEGMFSVLDIGKDTVDISIIGHKIKLTK